MGDTAWPFFTRSLCRWRLINLAKRAAQGFNVVQGVLGWSAGTGFENPVPTMDETGPTRLE